MSSGYHQDDSSLLELCVLEFSVLEPSALELSVLEPSALELSVLEPSVLEPLYERTFDSLSNSCILFCLPVSLRPASGASSRRR